jgi:hypothetical protein
MKKCITLMLLVSTPIIAQALDAASLDNSAAIIIHERGRRDEEHREISGNFWTFSTSTLPPGMGITGSTPIIGGAVPWTEDGSLHTRGLSINFFNNTQIVIEHPGLYQVDYNVTGFTPGGGRGPSNPFQFAGYLNGSIISNSIFSQGESNEAEVTGQFLVKILEKSSFLQLVNQTNIEVTLDDDAGTTDTTDFGNNISASIIIKKVGDLAHSRH